MVTLAQYNIKPTQVLHDATRCQPFDFARAKATPLFIPGQDHTRVPNILMTQKIQYLDDSKYQFRMRSETKAEKEGRRKT
jgi:hypothetical protein